MAEVVPTLRLPATSCRAIGPVLVVAWENMLRGRHLAEPKQLQNMPRLRIPCVGPWEHSVRRP